MELATKVDAAIEDGDSSCCHFCPDSLLDHIAAKVRGGDHKNVIFLNGLKIESEHSNLL